MVRRNVKKKHRRPVKGDETIVDTKPRTIKRKRAQKSVAKKNASKTRKSPSQSRKSSRTK